MAKKAAKRVTSPEGYEVEIVDGGLLSWDDLPHQQKAFVTAYVKSGDSYESAYGAGYKDNQSLRLKAKLLRKTLANHIEEQFKVYVKSAEVGIFSMRVLMELAEKGNTEAIRLQAAKEIRSATDGAQPAPQEKTITHNHNVSISKMDDATLDAELKKLRGEAGLTIDVTPENVETEERAGV